MAESQFETDEIDESSEIEQEPVQERAGQDSEQEHVEEAFEEALSEVQEIDAQLLRQIIEGLLLSAGRPLSVSALADLFAESERPAKEQIREALTAIADDCENRGFELKEVASGFRFQVCQHLSPWISRLSEEKPQRYTRALLETLGLIAYRQPITRGEIEEIRGVAVSSTIIRTLLDREWVRIVGHRDVPGRPAMFATTRHFLDYFNLKSLQELPPLSEIRDLEQLHPELDLGEGSEGRVLDLPDETMEQEELSEASEEQSGELIDEEEARAMAKRPLDEILGYGRDTGTGDDVAEEIRQHDADSQTSDDAVDDVDAEQDRSHD